MIWHKPARDAIAGTEKVIDRFSRLNGYSKLKVPVLEVAQQSTLKRILAVAVAN